MLSCFSSSGRFLTSGGENLFSLYSEKSNQRFNWIRWMCRKSKDFNEVNILCIFFFFPYHPFHEVISLISLLRRRGNARLAVPNYSGRPTYSGTARSHWSISEIENCQRAPAACVRGKRSAEVNIQAEESTIKFLVPTVCWQCTVNRFANITLRGTTTHRIYKLVRRS